MKLLSSEVTLYLYKSSIKPCMEYHCHVWACAPSSYLELLDIYKNGYAGLLVLHLLPLLNPWLRQKKKKNSSPRQPQICFLIRDLLFSSLVSFVFSYFCLFVVF